HERLTGLASLLATVRLATTAAAADSRARPRAALQARRRAAASAGSHAAQASAPPPASPPPPLPPPPGGVRRAGRAARVRLRRRGLAEVASLVAAAAPAHAGAAPAVDHPRDQVACAAVAADRAGVPRGLAVGPELGRQLLDPHARRHRHTGAEGEDLAR